MPAVVSLAHIPSEPQYVLLRALLIVITDLLLLLPFFLARIAGTPTGWLHPLIFPTLLGLAMALVQSPTTLLYPFFCWTQPVGPPFYHVYLPGWSDRALSLAHLKGDFLILLSVLALYLGFILFGGRTTRIRFHPPRHFTPKMLIIFGCLFAVFVYIIQSRGGIVAHMSSFGEGRHRALGEIGHLTVLAGFTKTVLLVWYIFDKDIIKKPWFLAIFAISLATQFILSGSRGSTLMPITWMLAVWIFHNRSIPAGRILIAGIFTFIALGVLGEVRTSPWESDTGEVDFSALTEFELTEAVDAAQSELDSRTKSAAFLPVVALTPDHIDLLWGTSYAGAVGFFVPRTLWPTKPRGIGAHVGAIIVNGRDTAEGYEGGGVPPGAVAEAYWNFHIPGVIGIFFLFGAFRRWLANLMLKRSGEPAAVTIYLLSVVLILSPTSILIIPYIQKMILLAAMFFVLGVLRLPKLRIS